MTVDPWPSERTGMTRTRSNQAQSAVRQVYAQKALRRRHRAFWGRVLICLLSLGVLTLLECWISHSF